MTILFPDIVNISDPPSIIRFPFISREADPDTEMSAIPVSTLDISFKTVILPPDIIIFGVSSVTAENMISLQVIEPLDNVKLGEPLSPSVS